MNLCKKSQKGALFTSNRNLIDLASMWNTQTLTRYTSMYTVLIRANQFLSLDIDQFKFYK